MQDIDLDTTEHSPDTYSNDYVDFNKLSDLDDSDDEIEDQEEDAQAQEHAYNLRASTRAGIAFFSTSWLDQDTSGNYDPDVPEGTTNRAIIKRRHSAEPEVDNSPRPQRLNDAKRMKTTTCNFARWNGIRLNVVLKLHSDAGKRLLAKFPDNWPEESWNPINGNDIAPRFANNADSSSELKVPHNRPYVLRSRVDTADLEDDAPSTVSLIGHPVARGCKACFSIGQRCSLLDPGASYPCAMCLEEDGADCRCELLIPPKRKAPCEQCKRRHRYCSYTDPSGDHIYDCEQCTRTGAYCVAGPAPEPNRARIADDGTPAPIPMTAAVQKRGGRRPPKERSGPSKYIKRCPCQPCKDAGVDHKCTLRRNAETWPCQPCQKRGVFCRLNGTDEGPPPIPTIDHRLFALRQHAAALRAKLQLNKPTTPAPDLVSSPNLPMFQISTLLAHPIRFNASPHSAFKPCHWHLSPAFGLTGLGPTPSAGTGTTAVLPASVSVTMLPSGLAFRELTGGHTSAALLPSRMCQDCTFERVQICACPAHQLVPLSSPTSTSTPPDDANPSPKDAIEQQQQKQKQKQKQAHDIWHTNFQTLLQTTAGTNPHSQALSRFCTLCPQTARFGCVTSLVDSTRSVDKGCGLRLCDSCSQVFTSVARDLDRTVVTLRSMFGARVKQQQEPGRRDQDDNHPGDASTAGGATANDATWPPHQLEKFWPLGLRADYEVYAGDGFLMEQVLRSEGL